MGRGIRFIVVASAIVIAACAPIVSSNVAEQTALPAWNGAVFISQAPLPEGMEFRIIGSVQADARVGYNSVESLFPLLAEQARKMGANAVVNAKGGHKVVAFSWAAPYVTGIAVKVREPERLRALSGSFH